MDKPILRSFSPEDRKSEGPQGLNYIKLIARMDKSEYGHWAAQIKNPPEGTFVIQVPLAEAGFVAHIEVQPDGKVLIQHRETKFDGYWSKETWIDLFDDYMLQKLKR